MNLKNYATCELAHNTFEMHINNVENIGGQNSCIMCVSFFQFIGQFISNYPLY